MGYTGIQIQIFFHLGMYKTGQAHAYDLLLLQVMTYYSETISSTRLSSILYLNIIFKSFT